MGSEADAVSEYVNSYESRAKNDGQASQIASFAQGLIFGWANMDFSDRLKVRSVEQSWDADGNYENYMVVVTESGLRIRITVEPDSVQNHV